jgi:polar amino acid transport system permease protein
MSRPFGWSEFLFILSAIRWTIALSLIAMLCGGVLGVAIAIMRTANSKVLRWIATGYIQLFQGTPVLMQLFIVYYGIAVLFNVQIGAWPAVILAFALYSGAFLGEIWRGSIQAIPKSQWEAARALALRPFSQLRYVILPQAFRISIPPTVGFLVQLIKSTSIAAIIGFVELTRAGQLMTNVTYEPLTIYPIVAALYFAMCWPLSQLSQHLEQRIDRSLGIDRKRQQH